MSGTTAVITHEDDPIAVFHARLFMKAVMWSLLTRVTGPDAAATRAFRRFNGACDVPNCAAVESWRPNGPYGFRVFGGGTTHLADASTAQEAASSAHPD